MKKDTTKKAQVKFGKDGIYQQVSDKLNGKISGLTVSKYCTNYGWDTTSVDTILDGYYTEFGKGVVTDEEVDEAKRLSIISKGKIDEQRAKQEIEKTKQSKHEVTKAREAAKKAALQVKVLEGRIVELEEMEYCFVQLAEIIKTSCNNLRGELPDDLYGLEKKDIRTVLTDKFDAMQQSLSNKTKTFKDEKRTNK